MAKKIPYKGPSTPTDAQQTVATVADVAVPSETALAKPSTGPKEMAPYDPKTSPAREAIPTAVTVPVLHVFQGLPGESDRWGDHKPGTWLESQTQEVIVPVGETREFVLINRTPRMILTVWNKVRDGSPPVFTCEVDLDQPPIGQIPPEYLSPPDIANNDPGGMVTSWDNEPQSLQIRLNWAYAVLFETAYDEPMMLMLSWTAEKVGRTIENKERTRAAANKLGAQWRLSTKVRKNEKGEWYTPAVSIAGDAVPKSHEAAHTFFNGMRTMPVNLDWGNEAPAAIPVGD